MKEQKQIGLLARIKEGMSLWMLMAFIELGVIALLSILLLTIHQPQKVIVTPPDIRREFWVQGSKVDPAYLLDMAKYFASDLLTYSPDNAPGQFESVLKYVDPALNNALRRQLMSDLEDIRSKSRSSVFWVKESKVEAQTGTVYLVGMKRDMMSGAVIGDALKGYKLTFVMKNRLVITGFEELKGMMAGGIEEYMRLQQGVSAQQAENNTQAEGVAP